MNPKRHELVMVPVPVPMLQSVYELLAKGMAQPALFAAERAHDNDGVEVEGQGWWTLGMVSKLKESIHLTAALALLNAAADASPAEVSMQEVAQDRDIDPNRLRAQMGALSKLTTKLFGSKTWPVSVRYGDLAGTDTEPGRTGLAYYRMTVEVAVWWKEGH